MKLNNKIRLFDLDMKDDPDCIADFRTIWDYALDQGTVVGCYKLNSDGQIEQLVGANMVFMVTKDTEKDLANFKVQSSDF